MTGQASSPVPFPARKHERDEPIQWTDYPRIEPGEYFGYCYWGKKYRDKEFKRWTCLLRWDVLSEDLQRTIAKCIPLWFSLGSREAPRASRRGKYLCEWVRANDGPPGKEDRLSPNVFTRRIARVEIGDTDSPVPYSVVKRIIRWETGSPRDSVIKSTSQGRQEERPVLARGFEP
jgi:hypothetical protein